MKQIDRMGWAVTGLAMMYAATGHADVFDDSHLTLGLRNFYYDRDFKQDNAPKSRVGSWSQGFDLQFKSGYTDGPVKFGLDAFGQYAYRLDGGGGRGPDTVLPYDDSKGKPVTDYGRASVAAKIKFSNTEVKIGEHRPMLPVAFTMTRGSLSPPMRGDN